MLIGIIFIKGEDSRVEFIFEDQWGRQVYDVSSEYEPPTKWDTGLIKSLDNIEPDNVLEIGGIGKTSVRFPKSSITVVNSNRLLYQICKERGVKSIFVDTYSDINLDSQFDVILLNPFIFPRKSKNGSEYLLSKLKKLLSTNGIIICSVVLGSTDTVNADIIYSGRSSHISQYVFSYDEFIELINRLGLDVKFKFQEKFKCYFVTGDRENEPT